MVANELGTRGTKFFFCFALQESSSRANSVTTWRQHLADCIIIDEFIFRNYLDDILLQLGAESPMTAEAFGLSTKTTNRLKCYSEREGEPGRAKPNSFRSRGEDLGNVG